MLINPSNVTVTKRARRELEKSILPGALSNIDQMRLVTIMVYTYGYEFVNRQGVTVRNEDAHYIVGGIEPEKLNREIIVELDSHKFFAIRFEFPFSRTKSYAIDFDGEHLIVLTASTTPAHE